MLGGAPVVGIEDSSWEQNADADNHNIYYKGTGSDTETPQSLGKYCAGCHVQYHSPGVPGDLWGFDNGGGSNPWLRHPADYAIPNSGEYTAIIGSAYDPIVPVGKPLAGTTNVVENGDTVMCLSCHRAHGSQYPDMLRWDKSLMSTKQAGAGAGTGCFKCHSAKDGS
jgi:predicted CXXCH cytochrome family protein